MIKARGLYLAYPIIRLLALPMGQDKQQSLTLVQIYIPGRGCI